ncbi:MAG TPA: hypothetical protein VF503_20690 [Sphingobium sp.]|uniref:hypothetical protein n=1 Tax=Sphingobium sp. TaxID=1912891 RepID=UPI002ED00236
MTVEERLIEAMCLWRRSPDREAAWLRVKAMWPDITREWAAGDYDARGYLGNSSDVPLRPLPLVRAEVGRMEEAGTWIARFVGERDRKLVVMVLGYKASDRRPPWLDIKRRMGIPFGAAGLTRRYERAVSGIVKALDKADRIARAAQNGQETAEIEAGRLSTWE